MTAAGPAAEQAASGTAGDVALCIATPNIDAYSETFIRAHIEHLPGVVKVIGRGFQPSWDVTADRALLRTPMRALLRLLEVGAGTGLASVAWSRLLAQALQRSGVEVVLAEYGPTGAAVAPACRQADVALVVHFHGFDASHQPTLDTYADGYAEMFRVAAAIVVVSHDMRSRVLALGAPEDKVRLCPYGVDTAAFAAAAPESAPPRFLSVGRFVEKKAPHLAILAFERASRTEPSMRLTMVGDGQLLGACRHLVAALGLDDRVEFVGPLSSSAVAERMRSARAFVQHSVVAHDGDAEGLPVAVLEASASGLPVVATRHAGIPDAIEDGVTGLLADEDDIEAMADHLLRLAQEPEIAAEMGRRGRQRIIERFSQDQAIARLADVVERART